MSASWSVGMMQQIAIGVMVVTMMAAIGLRTDPSDFKQAIQRPGPLLLALLLNLALVPALTLGVCVGLGLPEAVSVGLLLCAACPGGPTGPLFADMADGELASAVTVMIALALLSVFSAPPVIAQAVGAAGDLDTSHLLWPMMRSLALFQLLPLMVGMGVRQVKPALAQRLAGPMNKAANGILLLVIVGLLVLKGKAMALVGLTGVGVSILLVFMNLGIGALTPATGDVRRSLVLVTGVRNLALSLLLAASWFPDPVTDATILTFGLFTMILPGGVALLWKRRDAA